MTPKLRVPVLLASAIVAALALAPLAFAQSSGAPERFTAFAVNTSDVGATGAQTIEITIDRWTIDQQRDKLLNVLLDSGPEKLLSALQDAPVVGRIRNVNSIGYDLHYARRSPMPEGGERVVIATDRPIGFWEATGRPRSIDYPFTVAELHVNKDGEGDGKMSIATKITGDRENRIIVLEDYANQPITLNQVKRQSGGR